MDERQDEGGQDNKGKIGHKKKRWEEKKRALERAAKNKEGFIVFGFTHYWRGW